MGLIKTAIMTGGAIYAVKQIAKTAENHHSSSNQHNQQRDFPHSSADNYYNNYPEQQQQQQWPPRTLSPSDPRIARGYSAGDYEYEDQARNAQGQVAPPSYYQQQQQQAYAQPQGQSPMSGGRRIEGSSMTGLVGTAMDFIGNEKKGKKHNALTEFLGK
jgi:hypothetical protein